MNESDYKLEAADWTMTEQWPLLFVYIFQQQFLENDGTEQFNIQ